MSEEIKILIIEGTEMYQDKYQKILEKNLNTNITVAKNKDEALSSINSLTSPHLILLDADWKDGSSEMLKTIRSDYSLKNTPVILLTERDGIEQQLSALDAGADDFIEKNASPGVMIARVKNQIRHRIAKDRFEKMALDRDMFAAGVLHDIKNIETTIRAVCEFTVMQINKNTATSEDKILKNINLLISSATKLGNYASDVISSVRMTDKETAIEPVNLKELIDWTCKVLGQNIENNDQSLIRWKSNNELAPVLADANFLRLSIFNVIQNSMKYSKDTSPLKIEICQRERPVVSNERPHLVTCIRDFGPGVPKSDLKKIFQPFKRGSKPADEAGFGLGLSMVSNVISRMSGEVWAEIPEEGLGMIVCISLPKA